MTTQLNAQLQALFADYDADVLENSKKWAEGRMTALREYKASDEYKKIAHDSWTVYPILFAMAGGKTWYNVFDGNTLEAVHKFVEKNCAAIVEKRNAGIIKKLLKAGVESLTGGEVVYSRDGFNGFYKVTAADGSIKHVTIDTIIAGGYNIQCRHMRVLVKVK